MRDEVVDALEFPLLARCFRPGSDLLAVGHRDEDVL